MATSHRTAPRALAALAVLVTVLLAFSLVAGVARAAPDAQGPPSATPTTAPSATAEPSATSAPSATPTTAPSATSAPSATLTAAPAPSATALVAAPAQTVRLAITKTLIGSDVVTVGQYLTFTIQITNTGTTVVTDLPLVDEYAPDILQPALDRMVPQPSSSTPGILRWADLTATFGDLAPGQSVVVTTVFRAIRINDEVINRARVVTGQGSGGGGGDPIEGRDDGKVEGGSVTVTKALVPSFIDIANPVISFTMSLRNEGYTDIVRAPVVDTYRTDLLQFISASVPPDTHNPATGELSWDNLLAGLGVARLRPGETVTFSTSYRLLASIDDLVVNSFDAVDVEDEFGNRVASPRRAEVRIRITGIGGEATATPSATPEEERRRRATATAETPTATATAPTAAAGTPTVEAGTPTAGAEAPTAEGGTPAAEATAPTAEAGSGAPAGGAPTTLPATGAPRPATAPWLLGLLALAAGLALRGVARRSR